MGGAKTKRYGKTGAAVSVADMKLRSSQEISRSETQRQEKKRGTGVTGGRTNLSPNRS